MISIKKYLLAGGGSRQPGVADEPRLDPACAEVLFNLLTGLFERINEQVLAGDRCEDLRAQLATVKSLLKLDLAPEEASEIEDATTRILGSYQATAQQTATNTAVEMQHILGMLNQALMVLAGGSERSISRLQQIQDSLKRTSMLQDIIALKSSLADTVKFVQQESAREQQTAAKEFAAFETDVRKARNSIGNTFKGLPARPDGLRAITEGVKSVPPNQALYVVAFLFDRLESTVQRYGAAVAEELIFRVIKERLQPLSTGSKAFRWSSSSLVGVFHRLRDVFSLRAQLAELNRSPMVHRVTLGNRVAVLTLSPSYLVTEGNSELPAPLIEEVDRFTGVNA